MDKKALIPIAQGTEELEAITVIDLFRRAGIQVKVAGENEIVTCSRGTKLLPDILTESIDEDMTFDVIVIPGGNEGVINLMKSERLQNILQKHHQEEKLIGAICAGPTVLQQFKIINRSNRITSHPSVKSYFSGFDYSEDNVVEDGNIVTSRSAGTSIEFALTLINRLCGDEIADKISEEIVYR